MITPSPSLVGSSADRDSTLISRLQQSDIFREYQGAFEITTGLALALRAPGAFQAPLHGARRLNPFCVLMAGNNRSCSACLQLQQRVEEGIGRETRTLECFAGMQESAVPVWVGETLVGYLQTGQVFLQPPSGKGFQRAMKQVGGAASGEELREQRLAYLNSRVVTPPQYESILRLLAIFAGHLSAVGHRIVLRESAAEMPAIAKARAFIAEHQAEEIHLHDVARAVGMSDFYFCKLFGRVTGVTFTRYLAQQRVEVAKQSLQNPGVRITDVAYAAGFQSLSQFNRIFRRVAGETPTSFRDRLFAASRPPVPSAA